MGLRKNGQLEAVEIERRNKFNSQSYSTFNPYVSIEKVNNFLIDWQAQRGNRAKEELSKFSI